MKGSTAKLDSKTQLPYNTLDDYDSDGSYELHSDNNEEEDMPQSQQQQPQQFSTSSSLQGTPQQLPLETKDFANFDEGFPIDDNIHTDSLNESGNKNTSTAEEKASKNETNEVSQGTGSISGRKTENSSGMGFFSLTKKKKSRSPPRIHSSGIVNYGVGGNSDSESDASSVSVASVSNGYDLPFNMQAGYKQSQVRFSGSDDGDGDDDDLSIRTPIPTGPPAPGAVLPSSFLRDRSTSISNVSDLSEEESSVVKRQKREEENVGRLVMAAKQQQSFAQAWFTAGKSDNALPTYVPPKNKIPKNAPAGLKKKTSFKEPEKSSGPIDLDSGDVWDGGEDAEEGSRTNWEVGSFNYTGTTHSGKTKKRKNQNFIKFGVPEDEDLTTYYQGEAKCGDRVVCTIGNTRCSMIALIILALCLAVVIVGGTMTGVYLTGNPAIIESSAPSISPAPTISVQPSMPPSEFPSSTPSVSPTSFPSSSPSRRPSFKPSSSPSLQPSLKPSLYPSSTPSVMPSPSPSSKPSPTPSTSIQPSYAPSSSPTSDFSDEQFTQLNNTISAGQINDRFGETISINESGTIVAIGGIKYPDNKGYVTVYEIVGGIWTQKGLNSIEGLAVLSPSQSISVPKIDMSENGLTIVVGEYEYDTGQQDVGAVRVFTYNEATTTWIQVGSTLEGSPFSPNSKFGQSVAMSDDGTTIAVGAPGATFNQGVVYVYRLNAGVWEEASGSPVASASISNAIFPLFGSAISLSGDGLMLACSAPDGGPDFIGHGYVEVFRFDGSSWSINDPKNKDINYEGDLQGVFTDQAKFGHAVSLSRDGSRIAIGAVADEVDGKEKSGSVVVYELTSGVYKRIGATMIGTPSANQGFGQSVALSRDGTHVAVGAPLVSFSGSISVHRYNGIFWDPADTIIGKQKEAFGNSVAITVQDIGNGEELVRFAGGGPYAGSFGGGVARVYTWQGRKNGI